MATDSVTVTNNGPRKIRIRGPITWTTPLPPAHDTQDVDPGQSVTFDLADPANPGPTGGLRVDVL